MSSKIKIVPSANGTAVRTYANNPVFGYVVLESTDMVFANGWIKEKKRTCILRAEVKLLGAFAAMPSISGRICVQEFLANSIPAHVQKEHVRDDIPFAEAIADFIKKAGKDGPALTIGGVPIVRFTNYDPSGQSTDSMLQYDNIDEVMEWVKRNADDADGEVSASLPGGE